MKKKILFVGLGLILLFAVVALGAARYLDEAEALGVQVDFPTLLKEEILPEAILLVGEVVALVVMLWPTLSSVAEKVMSACVHFKSATEDVMKVSANGNTAQDAIKAAKAAAEAARAEAAAAAQELKCVKEILGLMACGDERLVKNGVARRIMEVVGGEEQ